VDNPGGEDVQAERARSLVVEAAEAGLRADRFLANRLGITRSQVRRLLARGGVRLDGRRLSAGDKGLALPIGGQLEVETFRVREEQRVPSEAGVLRELVAQYPGLQGVGEGGLRSGVVHRLDVDTSGVLLVATAQPAWERLRAAFRDHRVEKTYRALVIGHFPAEARSRPVQCEFGLVVAQHHPARVKVVAGAAGRKTAGVRRVRQSIRLVEHLRGASLLELKPVTGFLHQIRATLAHLGHPVLGDVVYGGEFGSEGSSPQESEHESDGLAGVRRHLLHAARLGFEEIRAESPDPEDFREILERLRR